VGGYRDLADQGSGRSTEAWTPSHCGLALTFVTVAVTGDSLSSRFHVTVHRPVESVVQLRVRTVPSSSTIRIVTDALLMAAPVWL